MNKKISNCALDNSSKDTFLKPTRINDIDNEKVSFSFEYFNGESKKNNTINYNSFYSTVESSRNAVSDFFNALHNLSCHKLTEILSSKELKNAYNIEHFYINNHIDRIEKVLRDCYRFPQRLIEEFDRDYYEFQISDGKRVIWHRVDNIIYPLFIDVNHMISLGASRNPKIKMTYNIKDSFTHFDNSELNIEEKNKFEYLNMIIEEYSLSDNEEIADIMDILKQLI